MLFSENYKFSHCECNFLTAIVIQYSEYSSYMYCTNKLVYTLIEQPVICQGLFNTPDCCIRVYVLLEYDLFMYMFEYNL